MSAGYIGKLNADFNSAVAAAIEEDNKIKIGNIVGIIEYFDPIEQEATVRPIGYTFVGNQIFNMPSLLRVPVKFGKTKNFGFIVPISVGDRCLLVPRNEPDIDPLDSENPDYEEPKRYNQLSRMDAHVSGDYGEPRKIRNFENSRIGVRAEERGERGLFIDPSSIETASENVILRARTTDGRTIEALYNGTFKLDGNKISMLSFATKIVQGDIRLSEVDGFGYNYKFGEGPQPIIDEGLTGDEDLDRVGPNTVDPTNPRSFLDGGLTLFPRDGNEETETYDFKKLVGVVEGVVGVSVDRAKEAGVVAYAKDKGSKVAAFVGSAIMKAGDVTGELIDRDTEHTAADVDSAASVEVKNDGNIEVTAKEVLSIATQLGVDIGDGSNAVVLDDSGLEITAPKGLAITGGTEELIAILVELVMQLSIETALVTSPGTPAVFAGAATYATLLTRLQGMMKQ